MSTLPRFAPAPPLSIEEGMRRRVDWSKSRTCAACGDVAWERDALTETCRRCWRVLVALPLVLAAGRELPENKL